MSASALFRLNTVSKFSVTIVSGEDKTCTVRFPTDEEWCERVRRIKVYRIPVGRDKFESNAPGQVEVDRELFEKIRLDKDEGRPEFDAAEASRVVSQLDGCRITTVERDGKQFRIGLEVPQAEVTVVLRSPTQRQAKEYEDSSTHLTSGRRSQEWRSSLEPAGTLFDSVFVSQTGYAGPIPIIHKYAAVRELLDQSEQSIGEGIVIPEE